MDACILKGQSVAKLYITSSQPTPNGEGVSNDLSMLRQSGDIDVWISNKNIEELVEYVKETGVENKATAAHVSYEREGVEIELHTTPSFLRCFWNDRKLKKWFCEVNPTSPEFNLVYMMVHMYHHMLFEGLGLRQIMDYFFVLKALSTSTLRGESIIKTKETIRQFGMLRFAKGMMWIMKEVFALEDNYLIFEASERYGRLILDDVMQGGNFGHHDERNKRLHGGSAIGRSLCGLKRNMKFFALGPWEILSSLVWSIWHWWWRKRHGLL